MKKSITKQMMTSKILGRPNHRRTADGLLALGRLISLNMFLIFFFPPAIMTFILRCSTNCLGEHLTLIKIFQGCCKVFENFVWWWAWAREGNGHHGPPFSWENTQRSFTDVFWDFGMLILCYQNYINSLLLSL